MQESQFVSTSFQDVLIVNVRLFRVFEVVVEIIIVILQYASRISVPFRFSIVIVVILNRGSVVVHVRRSDSLCVGLGGGERFSCTRLIIRDWTDSLFRLSHLLEELQGTYSLPVIS